MRDPKAIQELETQLSRDRETLADLCRREAELLQNIPGKGFHAEAMRRLLICQMRALWNSVEKREEMLAMAKH